MQSIGKVENLLREYWIIWALPSGPLVAVARDKSDVVPALRSSPSATGDGNVNKKLQHSQDGWEEMVSFHQEGSSSNQHLLKVHQIPGTA